MKKIFKFYIIIWVLALALFNVVSFLVPSMPSYEKWSPAFWVSYACITLAFIGNLVCSFMVFNTNNIRKTFYNIPLVRISYVCLIASFIAGAIFMIFVDISWIGILVCGIILLSCAIAIAKAATAVQEIERVEEKVKAQTFFIKSLTVDAETLVARAADDEAKAVCQKVYDAVRYSDPMSNDALAALEAQITIKFSALSDAVSANDIDQIKTAANEVEILIANRNSKCKLLK